MSELFESGFGFGYRADKEPATFEMVEEASGEDFEEFVAEISAPEPEPAPKAPAAPATRYEISKRPMRPKKRR